VAEYTHGHPFLTQYLCYQIWSRSPEEQAEGLSSEDATLKTSDLEDTINVRSMADALWRDAGTFEREIELLKNIALRRNIPFVASHRAIRNLQLQGWIVERDGNCAIRNPLYRRILEKILAINAQLTPIRTPTYDDCFQKLKNFDGWVAISIWGEGAPAPYEPTSDRFTLRLGMKYELRVTVAKGGRQPEDYQGKVKQLIIRGGDDLADAVRIGVRPESFYPFGLEGEEEAVFPRNPGESMRTLKFRLLSRPGYAHENGRVQGITEGNDETVKDVQLFINIYQDVSLVDVLRLWVRVC
jgi:hypothetical protein